MACGEVSKHSSEERSPTGQDVKEHSTHGRRGCAALRGGGALGPSPGPHPLHCPPPRWALRTSQRLGRLCMGGPGPGGHGTGTREPSDRPFLNLEPFLTGSCKSQLEAPPSARRAARRGTTQTESVQGACVRVVAGGLRRGSWRAAWLPDEKEENRSAPPPHSSLPCSLAAADTAGQGAAPGSPRLGVRGMGQLRHFLPLAQPPGALSPPPPGVSESSQTAALRQARDAQKLTARPSGPATLQTWAWRLGPGLWRQETGAV